MANSLHASRSLQQLKSGKLAHAHASTLPVVETFHSVQGEGFWTGTNAYFIRLAGCDVGCSWCDQKESWSAKGFPLVNIEALAQDAVVHNPQIVVVTGGEPLMHNLEPLTKALKSMGQRTHLETSGTHPLSGQWNWVTLSPKRHRPPIQLVYGIASELKVVVQSEKDLEWAIEQGELCPQAHKFLQPEWATKESVQLVFDFVLKNPKWRISIQTHKLLKVQ